VLISQYDDLADQLSTDVAEALKAIRRHQALGGFDCRRSARLGGIADRLTINSIPPTCGSKASKTRRSMAKSSSDGYSITRNQAAIIALFRVINRYVGNLPQ
jgi:hypothetical protein